MSIKHLTDYDIREAVAAGILNPALGDFLLGEEAPLAPVVSILTRQPLSEEELRARANFSDPNGVARKVRNAYANGFKMRVVK